jgi:riboflavin biosynthesis pyrimidine reductase
MEKNILEQYNAKLYSLQEKNIISKEQLDHFLHRGLQIINPSSSNQLKLFTLAKFLPYIIIGASKDYIDKLSIPYQATSFVAAESSPNSDRYIYKIPLKQGGGIPQLTGGKRKFGDNLYAAIHKIIMGNQAVLSSIYNLVQNKKQTLDWKFYASHFQQSSPDLYEDLCKLNDIYSRQNISLHTSPYFIIVARHAKSFQRSGIIEFYLKNQISIFNQTHRKIIFLTDQSGYDYCSKVIKESETIKYVTTGDKFNIRDGLSNLKKKYKINLILNDGGRIMSNGFKENGVIGEERITLEPYPGKEFLDFDNKEHLLQDCTLGIKGTGLDGSELNDGLLAYSIKINDQEKANVYVYPLCDKDAI